MKKPIPSSPATSPAAPKVPPRLRALELAAIARVAYAGVLVYLEELGEHGPEERILGKWARPAPPPSWAALSPEQRAELISRVGIAELPITSPGSSGSICGTEVFHFRGDLMALFERTAEAVVRTYLSTSP